MNDDNQAGWNSLQFGDVITYHNSGVYKSKELYGDQGENIIGISQLYSSLFVDGEVYKRVPLTLAEQKKHTLHENDLLYGESSLVRSGIARTVCVTSDGEGTAFAWHTRRLKIDQRKAYSPFLAYLLELDETRAKVESVATQTALTGITTKDYFGIPLKLPTLDCQRKIAKILTTVDNLIDQTQSLIDKYTAMKQGMMADLFSRGIDLSGTPETNKNYGQLRPSYEYAPELYQETTIGTVPLCWDINSLESANIVLIDGDRGPNYPSQDDLSNEGYCAFLSAKNVTQKGFSWTDMQYISFDKHNKLGGGEVINNDIVITTRGTVGNIALYNERDDLNAVRINSGMLILRNGNEALSPKFLYYSYVEFIFNAEFKKTVSGSAQPQLPSKDLKKFAVVIPSKKEQEEIVKRVESANNILSRYHEELEKYKLIKKGLMQDLLAGKVKV